MNLFNSIVRGFGSQIGRNVANDTYYNSSTISKYSKFTVFLGTMLVTLLSTVPGAIIGVIMFIGEVKNEGYHEKIITCTLLFSVLGGWFMYRYYQKQNQQYNDAIQLRREFITNIKNKRQEVEQSYISNEITKREYEVLMNQIKRMEKQLI